MQATPDSKAAPPTQYTAAPEADQTDRDEADQEQEQGAQELDQEGAQEPEAQINANATLAQGILEVEAAAASAEIPARSQQRRRSPTSAREKWVMTRTGIQCSKAERRNMPERKGLQPTPPPSLH